jgi:hypothetical protein
MTPVVYRAIIENGTDEWEKPGLAGWFLVVPALLALGNFLPRRKDVDASGDTLDRAPSRSWMPFLILMLWVTGSSVHLYCVGYVSDLAFHLWMLAPLALALAWTAWHRLADLLPQPMPAGALAQHMLRQALLVGAALVPLLALAYPSSHLFFALTLVNTALFGLLSGTNPQNKLALQLGLASGVALFAGIPMDWGSWLTLDFTRARAIYFCLGVYVLVQALRSKNPAWGLCGGLAAAVASALLASGVSTHWSLHLGLSFVVLHSLRWEERSFSGELLKGVVGLRIGTAVSWMTHAFVWTRVDGGATKWMIPSAAVLILLIYVLLGVVTGQWGARVVPAGAALSFLAAPANSFYDLLRVSPAGLTAVLGSFVLFGLGTLVAWTKHRWHPATHDE